MRHEQAIIKWLWLGISANTNLWMIEHNVYHMQRVILLCALYCCLLPQYEALRTCHSGIRIATQPSTLFSKGSRCINFPLPWSLLAWQKMEEGLMDWLWVLGTEAKAWNATVVDAFAEDHHKNRTIQAGIAATEAEAAKCQKCNDLNNYRFQPIETPSVYGKSTARFLSELAKKLVDMSVTMGTTVFPLVLVPGCGWRECSQHNSLCAS